MSDSQQSGSGSNKVVVIGLDGATFDIIKPLAEAGRLPNLARLMKEGTHGPLRSTIHPITPQAWTTFLTGKNAGKHGIFDFTTPSRRNYGIEFVNASRRKARSILAIASEAGLKVGSIGLPFTFPPEEVDGYILPGIDAPGFTPDSVYPSELHDEIKREVGGYALHLASPIGQVLDENGYRKAMAEEDTSRTEVSLYMLDKHPADLFVSVFSTPDDSQHLFWIDGDTRRLEIINEVYERMDGHLGRILDALDEGTSVFVISDHGAGPIKRFFMLNRWLELQGFLNYNQDRQGVVQRMLFDSLKLLRRTAKRVLPRWVKQLLVERTDLKDRTDSYLSFSQIDWSRTQAYGFGMYGNIFINVKGREAEGIVEPGEEYEAVRDAIIDKLSQLKDPESDRELVEKVYRREELFDGAAVDRAPDLLIRWKDYSYYTSTQLGVERGPVFTGWQTFDSSNYKHVGTHRLDGILIAHGSIIRQGSEVADAEIGDLTPTLMHILGLPIPADMDGRLLQGVFTEEFLAAHPPQSTEGGGDDTTPDEEREYTEDEEAQIVERLKALGYME